MSTQFRIIQSYEEFSKLRGQWNKLVQSSEVDHAFMRHEWFSCRMKHLGETDLCFVVGFNEDELVSAAPLLFTSRKMKGISVKLLTFAASTITPRSNLIAQTVTDCIDLFHFVHGIPGYDIMLLSGLDKEIAATRQIEELLIGTDGYDHMIEPSRQSPYLLCEGDWDSYYGSLSRSFRTLLQRGKSKLEREDKVETVKVTEYDTLQRLMPELVEVSSKSWKAQERTDLSALPQVVAFLDEFSQLSESSKLWELWLLKLDDKLIAFDYYLKGNSAISLIRTDFDLAYKALSPGNNLQLAILKDMFERESVWEYDMGGQSYDYKLKWTKTIRAHIDISIAGPSLYGRMLIKGKKNLLPLLKKLAGKQANQQKDVEKN